MAEILAYFNIIFRIRYGIFILFWKQFLKCPHLNYPYASSTSTAISIPQDCVNLRIIYTTTIAFWRSISCGKCRLYIYAYTHIYTHTQHVKPPYLFHKEADLTGSGHRACLSRGPAHTPSWTSGGTGACTGSQTCKHSSESGSVISDQWQADGSNTTTNASHLVSHGT